MRDFIKYFSEQVREGLFVLLLMTGDYIAYVLALSLAYGVRVQILTPWLKFPLTQSYKDFLLMLWMPILIISVFLVEGLYQKRLPFWEETQRIQKALFMSFLGVLALVSVWKISSLVSRIVILQTGIFTLALIPLVRSFWKPFLHRKEFGIEKLLIIGDEEYSSLVAFGLSRDHYMGLRATGWINILSAENKTDPSDGSKTLEEKIRQDSRNSQIPLPYLGDMRHFQEIIPNLQPLNVVIASPSMKGHLLSKLVSDIQRNVRSVYVIPNITQVNMISSELLYFFYEEIFLLRVRNNLKVSTNRWIKAVLDYGISLILLIPFICLMIVLSIAIKSTSRGPVIFKQYRMGKNGKLFQILKFRTMYEGSESILPNLLQNDANLSNEYTHKRKLRKDPRITPVGKFLRNTSLDELPQILNVLKGEMSLVGPRPALENEVRELYRDREAEYRMVKPGITGLWQVSGRNENSFDIRVQLDTWYIRNWSLWLDFIILVRTIGVVTLCKGSY